MGRSFSFALIAGTIFTVVIVINIIASSNLKTMDDDDHMHTGGGTAQPNIVLFIGSGLGPAGVTLARGFQAALRKGDASPPASLSFEPYLTATLRTRSSNSIVTDVAAAASALATGKKTANGMAAVDPQTKASVLSVFEKAKQAGLKTGFITTGELAGPVAAAFTSHMEHADMAEMVVSQQLTAKLDLLLGGGAKAYTNTTAWTNAAYNVLKTSKALEEVNKLPVLGLFADSRLRFEIDASKTGADQPSLHKMTKKALDLLHNDKGFFLVVQAANIEACAQAHDAACLAREVLALQESYEAVAELVAKKNTICLIASDRDVGGPALVDDKLAVLTPLTYSTGALAAGIPKVSLNAALVVEVIRNLTGISLPVEEAAAIATADETTFVSTVGDVLSKQAGLVWSPAYYNTAGDVNLYTCGDATNDVPRGNVDNTVVGEYLMKKLTASSMHAASPSPMAGHSGGGHHH